MAKLLPRNKLPILLTALASLHLTACQATTSSTTSCGALFKYTDAMQDQAAEEYAAAERKDEYRTLRKLVDDYAETRQTIRDCR